MRPNHSLLSFVFLPQNGCTALMEASKSGCINVAVKLLAAGAKPDHNDNVRKNTAFHSETKYVPATSVIGHVVSI